MSTADLKRRISAERLLPPERVAATPQIRRSAGGGGGAGFVYATVVRGLLSADQDRDEEDGPVEGYGAYVLRLESDTTAEWDSETNYVEDAYAIGSDNRKYQSLTGTVESPNVGNDPVGDEVNWEIQEEINPDHLDFDEVPDWRKFIPWFKADAVVPLVLIDGTYYFLQQMTRVSDSGNCSIRWNEDENRAMAVFG